MSRLHQRPFVHHAGLRRVVLLLGLVLIFAVGFGGSFTCRTEQGSLQYTSTNPPPR